MDPVVHFEMPYKDRDRIARFYESVFGCRTEKLGAERVASLRPGSAPSGSVDYGEYR